MWIQGALQVDPEEQCRTGGEDDADVERGDDARPLVQIKDREAEDSDATNLTAPLSQAEGLYPSAPPLCDVNAS